MKTKKIVIAGGSGFLGTILAKKYLALGFEVVVLSRGYKVDQGNLRFVQWNFKQNGYWIKELEGAEMLINLTGKSVDCRYNAENKKEIYASRLDSTFALGNALEKLDHPPKIWINAASATIYRHAEDRDMDESTGELGEGFSVDVCKKWERAFFSFEISGVRQVAIRTGIVLGKSGGAFLPLKFLAKIGLGGRFGNGRQFFSWIHEHDFAEAVELIRNSGHLNGPINITSPNPIPNEKFMKLLSKAMEMPIRLPHAKWQLEIGAKLIRTETELLLKSRRVVPKVLTDIGFRFRFPEFEAVVMDLVRS